MKRAASEVADVLESPRSIASVEVPRELATLRLKLPSRMVVSPLKEGLPEAPETLTFPGPALMRVPVPEREPEKVRVFTESFWERIKSLPRVMPLVTVLPPMEAKVTLPVPPLVTLIGRANVTPAVSKNVESPTWELPPS